MKARQSEKSEKVSEKKFLQKLFLVFRGKACVDINGISLFLGHIQSFNDVSKQILPEGQDKIVVLPLSLHLGKTSTISD